MAKNTEEVKAYVLRKLGLGIVDVELTPDHLNDMIDDTNRWYAFRAGQKDFLRITGDPQTQRYILPPHVLEVLSIRIQSTGLGSSALGTDDFSYAYSFMFGSWYSGSQYGGSSLGSNYTMSPYPYSDLVQRLQFLETIGRIWGGDPEWEWRPTTKELCIAPSSQVTGVVLVEVFTSLIRSELLDPEGEDFYLRWALAEAMETLGNIRTKHDSFPTVGGDRGMNGDALLAEARERKEKLDLQVLDRIRSTPIIIG